MNGMNDEWGAQDLASVGANDATRESHLAQLLARNIELLEQLIAMQGTVKPKGWRKQSTAGPSSRTVMTRSWLRTTLKFDGPQSWSEIQARAKAQGFSNSTLRLVRHDVAVKEYKDGRRVIWRLKED